MPSTENGIRSLVLKPFARHNWKAQGVIRLAGGRGGSCRWSRERASARDWLDVMCDEISLVSAIACVTAVKSTASPKSVGIYESMMLRGN
jgi:hypothetical protein